MAFTAKDWKNRPDASTPATAEALEDIELRLSGYTDQEIAVVLAKRGAANGLASLGADGKLEEDELPLSVASISAANTFTKAQTIAPDSNTTALTIQSVAGQTISPLKVLRSDTTPHLELRDSTLVVRKLTANGSIAPELHLLAQNGGGLIGIDVMAGVKSSDLAIGCLRTSDQTTWTYNGDIIYISNGRAAGMLEQVGIGWATPADLAGASGTARLTVASVTDGSGNVVAGHDNATILARGALGQTAPLLATARWSSTARLWSAFIDGSMEWRSTANIVVRTLGTDRKMSAFGENSTTPLLGHSVGGDAQDRFRITAIGDLEWSPGTGGSFTADCKLRRTNPNVLTVDDTTLRFVRVAGGGAITVQGTTDTNHRIQIQATGIINFGPGNAAQDTAYLARHTSQVLRYGDRTSAGKLTADGGLGAGNSVVRTTLASPGTVTRMLEVFDATGASIGAVPVYATGSFS
jgi:hypothetical protein